VSVSDPSGTSSRLGELLQLGIRAHRAGDLAAAERLYKKANKAAPQDFNALHLLGVLNAQRRQFANAAGFLAKAVAISPSPEALNNYGSVLTELGRAPEAIERLQQAIDAKPAYPEAHFNLGNALRKAAQMDQAISSYRQSLSLRPAYVEALQNLSDVLRETGQQQEAIDALRRAIALRADSAILQNNLGIALRDIGELDEACAAFDRAIALDGRFVHPYWHRVRSGTIAAGDPIILAMESLKATGAGQSPQDRTMLLFALGKAHDDAGDGDKAIANLIEANRLARDLVTFDEAADAEAFRQVEEKFTASFIGARTGRGNQSELPIFIVGFPRSGTSLIEQILSAHPAVHGAGEVTILTDIITRDETALHSEATPESARHLFFVLLAALRRQQLSIFIRPRRARPPLSLL
jgi:tetratricopeptide (TPR) repeat protein